MKTVTTNLDPRRYAKLLARALPKIIETEQENEAAIALVTKLSDKGEKATPEEQALADLLVFLIETFEEKHYRLSGSTPLSHLKALMQEHGLRQVDLVDVFGSRGIASEVPGGKRRISRTHAVRLGERVGLPASVFLEE